MKTVLLNSGGKDSLAAALLLYGEHELHSLYVHAGNPASDAEERVATDFAKLFCHSHKTIRLSGGPYEAPGKFGYAVMPYKAAVLHMIGCMYAETIGAKALATGQRNDVLVDDWDARLRVVMSMSKHRDALTLLAPLQGTGCDCDKVFEIIKDSPLWKKTIYCLHDPPCGTCGRCRLRQNWMRR